MFTNTIIIVQTVTFSLNINGVNHCWENLMTAAVSGGDCLDKQ